MTIFGLEQRDKAKRLITALAAIPCFPLLIFKVDRLGRWFGVVGQQNDDPVFYVRVRHWGRSPDILPDISWTSDPRKVSRGFRQRAEARVFDCSSGVRQPGLTLTYSSKAHVEACAIMTAPAS